MKPKAVLAYCREKGVKAIDIRFPDGLGRWRHFSIPASGLSESMFETGLGIESCLQYQSNLERTPWILLPIAESKYLDPLQTDPTLVLMASIQDAWSGEDAWFDPRAIASRATEAFRGAGLADEIMIATTAAFDLRTVPTDSHPTAPSNARTSFAGGIQDPDFLLRSEILNLATETGLGVERHYRGEEASSVFLLNAKPLVQACDEQMVLRGLIESTCLLRRLDIRQAGLLSKCALSFVKGNEPIVGGARGFGLSDLGWYAAGGLLKHCKAISAIAATSKSLSEFPSRPLKAFLSDRVEDSLVGVEPVSNDPRYRALTYRELPATCCPYLTLSAIAMAMLDGILHKIAPKTEPTQSQAIQEESVDLKKSHARFISEDNSFLLHADVFSERMITALCDHLETSND
ncbi:MAG: glutamine synthetase beta-grasp domain-containing protein [Pirellula sp.]